MTLLERGLRWMEEKLPAAAKVAITIRAGIHVLQDVDAVPSRSDFEQYNIEEATGTTEVFDWIVPEQCLVFAGQKQEPAVEWEIWHQRPDGRWNVFTCVPGANKRCYEVMDQLGLLYRIHSQFSRIENHG